MTSACSRAPPLYRPRDPRASNPWRLMDRHFTTFQRVYDARLQPTLSEEEEPREVTYVDIDEFLATF